MKTIERKNRNGEGQGAKMPDLLGRFLASRSIINPRRDWIFLLAVFVLLVLGALAFDGFMYEKISSGEMYVSVGKSELDFETLKSGEIEEVIGAYAARRAALPGLKLEHVVDPSL